MIRIGSIYRWPLDLLSIKYFWEVYYLKNIFNFKKCNWMTVEMQKENAKREKNVSLKEVWFSVSAVLPVFGKPSLLFPLGVGAAGPKASCQQDRIHLEGGAGLRACEWIFTLSVPHSVQWPAFSMWGQVCTYFVFQLGTWDFLFGCFGQTVSFPRTAQTLKSGVHFPTNITVIHVVSLCAPSAAPILLLWFHRIWLTGWLLWIQKRRLIPCSTTSSLTHLAWGEIPFLCFIT